MSLELSLWEATRPAYRVRYVHDRAAAVRIPLYASFGIADARTARAKLARIVRGAPEVMVKVTGRQRAGGHVRAHLDYIGRKGKLGIETRDGEVLSSRDEIAERATEWSDTVQWRSRLTVSSVSMVFSMPAGTDPDKVLSSVRAVADAEFGDNHDYVMALHTDTPRPHVHLTVQAEGLDRKRFNPRPPDLNRLRERFARELRARGVAAEATPRRARGKGVAGSSTALVKLRARLRAGGGTAIADADRRTNHEAVDIARGNAALPAFVGAGGRRWQDICAAYDRIATSLDATGVPDDRRLAGDLRDFLAAHARVETTPELFAHRHARALGIDRADDKVSSKARPGERGRGP